MANSSDGGALPFPMPPSATGISSVPKGDKAIARQTAAKVLAATKNTKDPQLKAAFSQTLASLNSYLAQDNKERKSGTARKVSSKSVTEPKPGKTGKRK